MAITAAAKVGNQISFGKEYTGEVRIRITLDNSYPAATGYINFIASTVKGISGLEGITIFDVPTILIRSTGGAYLLTFYNRATDALRLCSPVTGLEVVNATDLSAYSAVEVIVRYY